MKKILIIAPHFPPSNLAGVHRSRLFAQHLPSFGWEPVMLTIHEKFYEEELDWNLFKLLPNELRIEKVNAYRITKPRMVGDIGLRGFLQLRKRALQLLKNEKFDFVYISIPSFYVSLIGPYLYKRTGVKYGIDYIDPWVHDFPGSDKLFSRHWFSKKLSKWLEPIAVKQAALITGVAESYYGGVIERNPELLSHCIFGAMPYGGEIKDHEYVKELGIQTYLFEKSDKIQLVFAGAVMPKSILIIKYIFSCIKNNLEKFKNIEIHFIGTGKVANDGKGFHIKEMAQNYGLWQSVVFEYPKRIPYLDVLSHLAAAKGIMVIGSTEPHYTPSKIYQAILSDKPVLAFLHEKSNAVNLFQSKQIGQLVAINETMNEQAFEVSFLNRWDAFLLQLKTFDSLKIDKQNFNEFSAWGSTSILVNLLNKI